MVHSLEALSIFNNEKILKSGCDLNVKCLSQAQVFECLVPSWLALFVKVVDPLGNGALLEEVSHWGRGC